MSAPDAPASSGLSDERKRVLDRITVYGEPKDLMRQALHILSHDDEGARLVKLLHDKIGFISLHKLADAQGIVHMIAPDVVDGKLTYDFKDLAPVIKDTLGVGAMIAVVAHELRHVEQIALGIANPGQQARIVSPLDAMVHNWYVEADAMSTEVGIAWRLKELGHREAWDSLTDHFCKPGELAHAYAKVILGGGTADDAKLAAFNTWFETGLITTYSRQAPTSAIDQYEGGMMLAAGALISELTRDDQLKFGSYMTNAPGHDQYKMNIYQVTPEGWDIYQLKNKAFAHLKGVAQIAAEALKEVKPAVQVVEELGSAVAPIAKGLAPISKKAPVIGAAITAGFVIDEVTREIKQGKFLKAGTAAVAGAAETVGNIAGFGIGDIAREGVREVVVKTLGEENAPAKSGLRSLGESAFAYGSKFMSTLMGKPQEPAAKPAAPKEKFKPARDYSIKI